MENQSMQNDSFQYLTKINLISIILGIIGFFVSLYALIIHLKDGIGPHICDVNSSVNCTAVIGSSFGEFAAIPLGAYGMTYFAIIISAALMPKFAKINKKWLAFWEFIIAVIGIIVVCVLMYISYMVLQKICIVCSIIQGITILYAGIKVYQFIATRKEENLPKNDSFIRFIAVAICLGLPPLGVGLLSPFIASFFKSDNKEFSQIKVDQETLTKSNNVDLKMLMMTFNKTNFVGNGEDYRRGSDNAKVIIQIFSDFGCPHCRIATEAILKAQDNIGLDKILFVYRFFPLSNKCNSNVSLDGYPFSCSLAEATRCSGQQGKFWEFKSWAFEGQQWDNAERAQKFSLEGMKAQALALNMNVSSFVQCLESHVELQKIKDDSAIANKFGIEGTPLIIINGEQYNGAHTSEAFSQAFYQILER